MAENEIFNKLEEIVCSAPIGGVKEDLTITTLGEIFSDMAIKTLVSHLMKNGVGLNEQSRHDPELDDEF